MRNARKQENQTKEHNEHSAPNIRASAKDVVSRARRLVRLSLGKAKITMVKDGCWPFAASANRQGQTK
jgi:hypothetical protein